MSISDPSDARGRPTPGGGATAAAGGATGVPPAQAAAPQPDLRLEHLRRGLEHAAHLLPTQGPIGVFVHHNTLHAFQHQDFEKAVVAAGHLFKAEPFLPEETYQSERARGRILEEDVEAVLKWEPDAEILGRRLTRRQLRRAMLVPGVRRVNGLDIAWAIEEGGWLQAFRQDLPPAAASHLTGDTPERLWRVCLERVQPPQPPPQPRRPVRPAEAAQARFGVDLDQVIHPPLIRLAGAYLDQGLAYWAMPLREEGLLAASRKIMGQPFSIHRRHLGGVRQELRRQEEKGLTAEQTVLEALDRLAVPVGEWQDFITQELLALRGWAGMVRMLERDPTLAPHDRVRCSLMEFLALRLTYTLAAVADLFGDTAAWRAVALTPPRTDRLAPVARFYDVMQLVGLPAGVLATLSNEVFDRLAREVAACNETERRRLLHLAYERRHERRILIPLFKHRHLPRREETDRLAAQVMFCIDEREESLRRALEEVDPSIETVGAAGFFGVAIDYAGIDDAAGMALCPVVVRPQHTVREVPVDAHYHLHDKRQWLRRAWAGITRGSFISTRTLVRGWLSTACLGFFSLFPLVLRLLSPRGYGKLIRRLNRAFLPEPRTEVAFMRDDGASRDAATGLLNGFTEQEMADRIFAVLGPAGMHKAHARLVVVLGHGSTSLNNPYESAYCCGACGGRGGGPNARVFAIMANRPGVRHALRERGVIIPEDTWFLGGSHDTCSDDIDIFDLELMPESHRGDYHRVRQSLDQARVLNADERVRRFGTAGPGVRGGRALRHVQERAEHIAEPRPEYGHCTNAVTYVGRREYTRGLFLDRRAFLVSYDAAKDPGNEMLARVLAAIVPVCGGINLEYYFSTVDNDAYGSGTKLPHNITGLIGVMNGFQGDLRTGLPLQTVDIHEPLRNLLVVETTPARVMSVIRVNPELVEFVCNRWIRLATMDPDDGHIEIYRGGEVFEPLTGDEEPLPVAPSSRAWYRGRHDHLPLARIEPSLRAA